MQTIKKAEITDTQLAARIMGKKGGRNTLVKYGKKQMIEWGKLGGRPRKKKKAIDKT